MAYSFTYRNSLKETFFLQIENKMSSNNSASALAEQNAEDTYEQYEKYLNAGR